MVCVSLELSPSLSWEGSRLCRWPCFLSVPYAFSQNITYLNLSSPSCHPLGCGAFSFLLIFPLSLSECACRPLGWTQPLLPVLDCTWDCVFVVVFSSLLESFIPHCSCLWLYCMLECREFGHVIKNPTSNTQIFVVCLLSCELCLQILSICRHLVKNDLLLMIMLASTSLLQSWSIYSLFPYIQSSFLCGRPNILNICLILLCSFPLGKVVSLFTKCSIWTVKMKLFLFWWVLAEPDVSSHFSSCCGHSFRYEIFDNTILE